MQFWNLNAFQTYVSAALVAVPALFVSVGCSQLPAGGFDCSHSTIPFLTPAVVLYATGLLGTLKFFVIPAIQPGGWFRNLFEPKVPVSETKAPGTVTPAQVKK